MKDKLNNKEGIDKRETWKTTKYESKKCVLKRKYEWEIDREIGDAVVNCVCGERERGDKFVNELRITE